MQTPLTGTLDDIFKRISILGFAATCNIINGNYKLKPQNHSESTYFIRRQPKESEITLLELQNKSSEYLYNKIRMLSDPYPNSYIRTSDGKKLIIKDAEVKDF